MIKIRVNKNRFSFLQFILLGIVILGFALRFAGLGANPPGLTNDEADEAYDAYSLLKTGKDQWGAVWPITSFRGFGDNRSVAYTYFVIPSVYLFGLTSFAVRIPSAIFGTLSILIVYLFAKELLQKNNQKSDRTVYPPEYHGMLETWFPLLSAFFLAISPWHIGMSRLGIEETSSVFMITLGLLLLLKGRWRSIYAVYAIIPFGISVYIYTPNMIFTPMVILATAYVFWPYYRTHVATLFILFVGILLFSTPILLNSTQSALFARSKQVNFFQDTGTIDLLNEKRGSCLTVINPIVCRVMFNKITTFGTKLLSNYFYHFSMNLLSLNGTDTQFSIIQKRGLLYMIDYPFILLGLLFVIKMRLRGGFLMILYVLLAALPDSVTSDGHYGRFFISYPFWPIAVALGCIELLSYFRNPRLTGAFIISLYIGILLLFYGEYWTFYPYRYSSYSHYGYQELIQQIQYYRSKYKTVIVSSRVNDVKQYIYYAFYTRYDPMVMQQKQNMEVERESNGWVRIKRLENIQFLPSLPRLNATDAVLPNVLLIGAPQEFPKEVIYPVVFEIKDRKGDVLFQAVERDRLIHCLEVICVKE